MKIDDYIGLVGIAIVESALITFVIVLFMQLVSFNYDMALNICRILNVPKDLALTVNSMGFANNITLFFTILEIVILCPVLKLYYLVLEKIYECRYLFY